MTDEEFNGKPPQQAFSDDKRRCTVCGMTLKQCADHRKQFFYAEQAEKAETIISCTDSRMVTSTGRVFVLRWDCDKQASEWTETAGVSHLLKGGQDE